MQKSGQYLSRSVGERWSAEPTGGVGESPVRASPRARYLPPGGMACGQWQWSRYGADEVGERGGPCPALMDTINDRP